jgi:hypothetical protein
MDSTRLYVDFNELIEENLVLLSQKDTKLDFDGNEILLFEGKQVDIYEDDIDENGFADNLLATGTVEINNTGLFPACKWNCRINDKGIQNESEITDAILQLEDAEIVTRKLLDITFNNDNWKWVQEKCLKLLDNKNEAIKGLAVTCLGHIARIHKKIDREKVLKAFADRISDETISSRIEDAIEDIKMFTVE